MRADFDPTKVFGVTRSLFRTRDDPDRDLGSSELSIASYNGSMLRPIEIELEDHAVRLREIVAAPPRQQWTQRSVLGTVTHTT